MRDCYFDSNDCYVCPELPGSPGTPTKVEVDPNLGWNAGAVSIATLSGDVYVSDAFDAAPSGIVIGFKADRVVNTDPTRILHGLYFYTVANVAFVEVRELGQRVGQPMRYTLGTPWMIRREADRVTYWMGSVLFAATAAKTLLPLLVNACLYSAGDSVP